MSHYLSRIKWSYEKNNENLILYTVDEGGNISCPANGQSAFVDSNLSCLLYRLPFFLETIGFGYICFPLIFAIILISIFGKINENYKYFFLNQAFWDLLVIYNFLCSKPSWNAWFYRYSDLHYTDWLKNINQGQETCFYTTIDNSPAENYFTRIIKALFQRSIFHAVYGPVFLLTFSRFLTMYFSYFKEIFKSTIKVVIFIISFNIFFIVAVNLEEWHEIIINLHATRKMQECLDACGPDRVCNVTEEDQCVMVFLKNNLQNKILVIYKYIQLALPSLLLIFADIFAISLFIKNFQQLKFRSQINNIQNILSSLRIALVIFFQCLSTTFLFFISAFEEYLWYFQNRNSLLNEAKNIDQKYIYDTFPTWFRFLTLPEAIQCFIMIRIFLDSIIILFVLSCYRKIWLGFFNFVIGTFKHPKVAYKKWILQKHSKVAVFISSNLNT